MKQRIAILLLLLLSLFPISMVFSNPGFDDMGKPNDPAINPRANACYEGGTMENKCTTDWAWNCGWYLIRFEAGIIPSSAFPAECMSVLSVAPVVSTPGAPTMIPGPTDTITPTSTLILATSTMAGPTSTDTPTATSTFVPPTATDTPTATSTFVLPTVTDTPTPTSTYLPTATSTPL